jgi:uncharacterized protein YcbK (DUF882 family)
MTSNKESLNTANEQSSSRRRFLQLGLGVTSGLVVPQAFAGLAKQRERKIALINLHTGEKLNATYWAEGEYQQSELKAINHILRDHRTGDIKKIDPKLLNLLTLLHHNMDGKQPFHVISGYRSPFTNAQLSQQSSGVAKKSFHMKGMAIDIRLPGRDLAKLNKQALKLRAGGVGYYPKSDFIHVDTGHVRSWS